MGKGTDLWDDSALINAFDNAMTTYKVMHDKSFKYDSTHQEKPLSKNIEGPVLPEKTSEHIGCEDSNNSVPNSGAENHTPCATTNAISEDLPIQEANLSADINVLESCSHQSYFPRTDGEINNPLVSQSVDYDQLVKKYYELEEQKQSISQQLYQAGYWNYQTPVQGSTCEAHQLPASDAGCGMQLTSTACSCNCLAASGSLAYCPTNGLCSGGYGCCSVWATCCTMSQANQCPGCKCPAGGRPLSIADVADSTKQTSQTDDVSGKTGEMLAEKAISSLLKEIAAASNVCEGIVEVKDKEEGSGIRQGGSQAMNSETDLSAVLRAWYDAGFHTGRYLMEQQRRNS